MKTYLKTNFVLFSLYSIEVNFQKSKFCYWKKVAESD